MGAPAAVSWEACPPGRGSPVCWGGETLLLCHKHIIKIIKIINFSALCVVTTVVVAGEWLKSSLQRTRNPRQAHKIKINKAEILAFYITTL